jgi:hypothetical protein
MALTSALTAKIEATLTGSADHGTPTAALELEFAKSMASGTGSNQADKVYSDQRTINASSDETLDLTNLTDVFGASLSFAKVKAILIKAAAGNTNNVVVGNATNPFAGPLSAGTTTISISPGGAVMLAAPASGWTVTGGSADEIKIANSGAGSSVTYDIVIVGTSA